MNSVKRYEFIDLFKTIGIIFMVMGHVGFGDRFAHYIAAFHMPMFFFISGYLFKAKYSLKEYVKRKFNSLIKPYFYFGILNAILCFFFVDNFKIGTFFEKLFFFNNRHMPVAGALWFLTCMFFVNLLFYLFNKRLSKWILGIILFTIAILEYYLNIKLPYSIDCALYMLPVFYIGFLFKNYEPDLGKIKSLIFKNGYCTVRTNVYSNLIFFYFNATLATLAYFYLAKSLNSIVPKLFLYIGRNSINYLALNQIVIYLVNPINGVLNLLLSLLGITVLSELVNKTKNLNKFICSFFQGGRNLTK